MLITTSEGAHALEYCSSGLFVTEETWIHPLRRIDSYEVIWVTRGEVYLREEETAVCLRAGDAMLLRPGVEHGGTRESTGCTSFFWAHFRTGGLRALGLSPGAFTSPEPDRLTEGFRRLLHVANTPGYPAFAAEAALGALLGELAFSQAASRQDASRLLREVAEWIRIHSEEKLTVRAVAGYFAYHPDYLCALMRRSTGSGLKEYINSERLKRLKMLLMTTNLSVKELAARMGFGNENQLVHYFKYHEGVSPARFRNLYVNTHLNRQ